jgi:hypothetical protein
MLMPACPLLLTFLLCFFASVIAAAGVPAVMSIHRLSEGRELEAASDLYMLRQELVRGRVSGGGT